MATIKVKFRPSTVPGKAGTVVYQVIHRRKVRLLSTHVRMLPARWEEYQTGTLPADNSPQLYQIERGLERLKEIVRSLEQEEQPYSVDDITERYHKKDLSPSLFEFMRQIINDLTQQNKFSTAHNYQSTMNSLRDFAHGVELIFADLNATFIEKYEAWLSKRDLSRNTLSFYMRILRATYNKAVRAGWATQTYPFQNVYTGIERTRKRAVPESTIARISQLELPPNSPLSMARDLFLFCYGTRGMSFVDLAHLRPSDIRGGVIRYNRRKTGQRMEVRIEKPMADILKRYKRSNGNPTPFLFPLLTANDQAARYRQYQTALRQYNRLLGQLSRMVEADSGITSYVARHSWATAARAHNIPIAVISEGMGHTSERTTEIYLASLDNSVIDNANRIIVEWLETVSSRETELQAAKVAK